MTVPQWWKRGQAVELSAKEYSEMTEKLYKTLWTGKVGYSSTLAVAIKGDTTKLHLAEGLTKAEEMLAKRIGLLQHISAAHKEYAR